MSALWARLRNLVRQSRIRLPSQALSADDLAVGDWLTVCGRDYRVTVALTEVPAAFLLEPVEPSALAWTAPSPTAGPTGSTRLIAPHPLAGCDWELEVPGGQRLRIPGRALARYAVAAALDPV